MHPIEPMSRVQIVSWGLAIAFACGAVFHAVAALSGTPTAQRHAVFVLINAAFAFAFAVRWRHVLWPALLLAAQQAQSHGADFLAARDRGEWDVMSLCVLAMLPVMLVTAWSLRRTPAQANR
jgi:hypothetical protein